MNIEFFIDKMNEFGDLPAVAAGDTTITYNALKDGIYKWREGLKDEDIKPGDVVSFDGDYSVDSISLLFALCENSNIVVPLSTDSAAHHEEFKEIAMSQHHIRLGAGTPEIERSGVAARHPFYDEIRRRNSPGLILFSSGSTGKSKAAVHDLGPLLEKFKVPRKTFRTIIFLQLDHIGGINTLLYTISNGGMIIVPADRSPATVCRAIQDHKAELLPTSPTFLNLLLLSGECRNWDLSSLKLITYGTEPMQESTLKRVSSEFPGARLQQTYGLSELGILRSKSKDSKSLWVKVGGEDFQTKIVDGRLRIKSRSAMLGYLNAPSPFDEDGYFMTGDIVIQDGEWLKILGRESEIINVGGYKVFPAEVESTLLEMDSVEDVVVFGMDHGITGRIVAARVRLNTPMSLKEFKIEMRKFGKSRLQPYKIPGKIILTDEPLHNERFKRMRR